MSLSVKYSWAMSDNKTDLGLKLAKTAGISTGCIISVVYSKIPPVHYPDVLHKLSFFRAFG